MAERVVPSGISVRREPNAPDAVLVVTGAGSVALALSPHFDDADRDCEWIMDLERRDRAAASVISARSSPSPRRQRHPE
jgi:hypothetical protein